MKKILPLIILSLFSVLNAHSQATEIFFKIIDAAGSQISGECTDLEHPNEIVPTTFGQKNINCSTITDGASCSGKPGHFIFNMNINKSLPLLKKALYNAEHLLSVDIFLENQLTAKNYTV
ncbi:MAG: hypothetical protein ABI168_04880 [Ginsengibacter sp.]